MIHLGRLAVVLAGKVLAQGSLLLCGMIVARCAGPGEFALYAVALTITLLLDACLGAPLDHTVVRLSALHAGDRQRVERLQGAVFRLKLLTGAGLAGVAACFGPAIAGAAGMDGRPGLVWSVAAATGTLLLVRGVATFLQAQSRFRVYSSLETLQGAFRILFCAALAWTDVRDAAFYLASFAVASAGTFIISMLTMKQRYMTAPWPKRDDMGALLHFLGVTAGIIVLGTITGRTDLLFLARHVPATDLAHYAAAAQLAAIPTLLAGYASIVMQPHLIAAARSGELPKLVIGGAWLAAALGGGILAVIASLGAPILGLVYGPAFTAAASILLILMLGCCIDLLSMPLAMTFVMQFRPRAALAGELVITLAYCSAASLVAQQGVEAMAWAVTALRAAKCLLYMGITLHDLSERRVAQVR